MWYVVQVYSGREEYCLDLIKKYVRIQAYKKCCIPEYVRMRKFEGSWECETRTLFPGYIFIQTDSVRELFYELKNVPRMTKLIGNGKEILPLTYEEERFLGKLTNDKMVLEQSKGIIQEGKTIIMSGPLVGMEAYIKKIDRHKREALLEIFMFERKQTLRVGLEIIHKG